MFYVLVMQRDRPWRVDHAFSLPMESALRNTLLLLVITVVAGCTEPKPASTQDAADSPAKAMPASPVAGSGPPAPGSVGASDKATAQAPAAKLALDGDGLRIFIVPSGTSRAVLFGLGKAETLDMLETVQGAPPATQGENIDCGATNAIWTDGLTVWFARDEFVGWSVGASGPSLATAGGLRVGATRSEVENGATVARIAPSSLGEEFTAGGIAGLLDSTDANARVTHLWAGTACVAR